ncbi:MAG: pyridoxamine 5'-phosphate oxidase family protein [Solirubrobacterales bacterium]|nr:pyridoxamine 5'-phosphate oxidase family protein [Solirubrobacterales bacterium]
MSDEEIVAFLEEERIVTCGSIGKDGWPHLMPLWYVVRDGDIWAWTFAKSQKVKNLKRDSRASIQVEAGDSYDQLRGVMMKTNVELINDIDQVFELGLEIMGRYAGGELGEAGRDAVEAQAAKRVAMHFVPVETATWDHRKLGGVY